MGQSHFAINSTKRQGDVYTLVGEVIASHDPGNVGLPITIVADADGEKTTATITLGANTFKGAGLLVVIAIIAVLIG